MTIRLRPDEPIQAGLRRIAADQIQQSIDDLSDRSLDRSDVVHDVRKRCKLIRGLLRLAKPSWGDIYRQENAAFREISRNLSGLRDADAALEAFGQIRQRTAAELPSKFMNRVNKILIRRSKATSTGSLNWKPFFSEASQEMQDALQRVPKWIGEDDRFSAIRGGLRQTYRRGEQAMQIARKNSADDNLHDWRKHVKYQMYQVRMLRDFWKPELSKRGKELKRLSDLLGDDHDLVVLSDLFGDHADFKKLRRSNRFSDLQHAIGRQRGRLQTKAFRLGTRLFSQTGKEFAAGIEDAWEACRK